LHAGFILAESGIGKQKHLLRVLWDTLGPYANSGRIDLLTLSKPRPISYTSVPHHYSLTVPQFGAIKYERVLVSP
jgi:hypothetical protein